MEGVGQACRRDVKEVEEEAELAKRQADEVVTPVTATLDLDRKNHILGDSSTWLETAARRVPTPQPRRVLYSAASSFQSLDFQSYHWRQLVSPPNCRQHADPTWLTVLTSMQKMFLQR